MERATGRTGIKPLNFECILQSCTVHLSDGSIEMIYFSIKRAVWLFREFRHIKGETERLLNGRDRIKSPAKKVEIIFFSTLSLSIDARYQCSDTHSSSLGRIHFECESHTCHQIFGRVERERERKCGKNCRSLFIVLIVQRTISFDREKKWSSKRFGFGIGGYAHKHTTADKCGCISNDCIDAHLFWAAGLESQS